MTPKLSLYAVLGDLRGKASLLLRVLSDLCGEALINLHSIFTIHALGQAESFQPIHSHNAFPITSSRSRPLSHGSSSVNNVMH